MESITVRSVKQTDLAEFLQAHDYGLSAVSDDVSLIRREEMEIFLKRSEGILYFECDLGEIGEAKSVALYEDLLDLNTEILPVSIGLDKTSSSSARIVLIESRDEENLDENEILGVLKTMEVALAKVEVVLSKHLN